MRKLFSCFLLGLQLLACGQKPKPHRAYYNTQGPFGEHTQDAFIGSSRKGVSVAFLFYDRDSQLISARDHDFPVGAQSALLSFINDEEVKISEVNYTSCCNKTFPATYLEIDSNMWQLENFNLANDKWYLTINWSQEDELRFSSAKSEEA